MKEDAENKTQAEQLHGPSLVQVSSWELEKKKLPVRCVSWEIHRKSCRVDTAQLQGPGIS